jgi:hypothetical protein
MAGTLIVHDKRVRGGTPRYAPFYTCDGKTLLLYCIQYVRSYAKKQGGLDELQLLCHGYYDYPSHLDEAYGMSLDAVGGYGLDLCKEGLHLGNVSKTESWKHLIKRITLISCGIGNTLPGNEGTAGDGERFCGELALWTRAEVVASSDTQEYTVGRPLDLGPWEGQVWLFDPITGLKTLHIP